MDVIINGGFVVAGFLLGYIVCAIYLGGKLERLEQDIKMIQTRDERGRFVSKSKNG